MTSPTPADWTTTEWKLGDLDTQALARRSLQWFAIGGLVFGALALRPALAHNPFSTWWNLLPLLGALVVVSAAAVVVHEAVHGIAMARYGARPQFGVGLMDDRIPYAYATAPGFRFTQSQFWWVAMLPTFVVNGILALLVLLVPWGPYLVLPAAFHLSGCVGDWIILREVSSRPTGTLVEDTRDGVILHSPPVG